LIIIIKIMFDEERVIARYVGPVIGDSKCNWLNGPPEVINLGHPYDAKGV
jgi:hypothetical protein